MRKRSLAAGMTVLLLLGSLAGLGALPAAAATGGTTLTVGPSRITADQPLTPGHSYTLPAHTVTNGSERELAVQVSVSDHRDPVRARPPAAWLALTPTELRVAPGATEQVQVTLDLPADAPAGPYRAWLHFVGAPADAVGVVSAAALQVSFVFTVAGEPPFADLEGHWGSAYAASLARRGLVFGVGDGRFEPDRAITRAELAVLLGRLARWTGAAPDGDDSPQTTLSDVPAGAWYAPALTAAAQRGLIAAADAPDGRFRPDEPVSRADMAMILQRTGRLLGRPPEPPVYARPGEPTDSVSRAEAVRALVGLLSVDP